MINRIAYQLAIDAKQNDATAYLPFIRFVFLLVFFSP